MIPISCSIAIVSRPMEQETDPSKIFEVMDQMGEGSYGTVYKARYNKNNRLVAIKIIPSVINNEDIMKEINILKGCRSNYIIRYYGSYYKDDDLWIIMEFGDLGSLADSINKEPNIFSEQEIQHLLASVLLGLAYLHSHKKIHRDIKASNVLLTKEGKAKLADFGVSAGLDSTMSKRNTVIGTPLWMAPEIIQEFSYDAKADIWSLGITAIELADGQPPYSNMHPMRAIFMIPNRPPPRLRSGSRWSNLFSDFISHCLEKNPEKRASARELLQHPFIKDAATELENNGGTSQVLKNLVDRMIIRREELARKKRLSDEANRKEGGIDGSIVRGVSENDFNENSTIVDKRKNVYRPVISSKIEIMKPPPVEPHSPPSSGITPIMQQARNRFFANNKFQPNNNAHLPIAHLQLASNANRHLTEQQQTVIEMIPSLSVYSNYGAHSIEWMKLKRRGEELRQQFADDFQVLFDSYYAEIQRISNELKAFEK